MTIERLDATTPDLSRQNVRRLAEMFPECVTEAPAGTASDRGEPVIDFDLLRQALADHLVEGPQERFRLDWPGKRQALLAANTPIDKTLRPFREESLDFETTRNIFIEGDNLHALKLLQETYLGKVKMIYIDPPYNTGNDFIYKDSFSQDREDYEAGSGQRDESGGRLLANPETNGRFHSDWLSMMYPRLKLARNLLRDDGVLFISIDDTEVANLRCVCDSIFGPDNLIAEMVAEGAGKNDARQIGVNHEYVLVYARERAALPNEWSVSKTGTDPILKEADRLRKEHGDDFDTASEQMAGWFRANKNNPAFAHRRYRFIDRRGLYKEENPTAPGGRRFDLRNPQTGEIISLTPGRGWGFDQAKFDELVEEDRITFVTSTSIMVRQYLHETLSVTPQSVFYQPTRSASERLRKLMQASVFDFPKDELVIQQFIEMATSSGDVIVDFFAGSATTAHAVMAQNALDGGSRHYVLVQLPEPIISDSEQNNGRYKTIADLSRERIRRAGSKILAENPHLGGKLDVGFRAFRIDSGNFHDVRVSPGEASQALLDGLVSHIKDDRSDEDLLFGALLRWGVDLTLRVRRDELGGHTIWIVDPPAEGETGAALIACFARPSNGQGGVDTTLADALAALKPLRVLFRDDGFASDAAKENVASRIRQRAPDTQVRVL